MSRVVVVRPEEGESIVVGNNSMTVKVSGAETDDSLFVAEHSMAAQFPGPPPHVHDMMDHSFYVLEGEVRFVAAGDEVIATVGCFVFVPRGTPHSFGNPAAQRARMLEINHPGGFERYYRELALAFPPGSALDPARVYEIQQRHGTRPA
jgi:mannose-6-phosphate isomerase-like protein (cupin superfamily)